MSCHGMDLVWLMGEERTSRLETMLALGLGNRVNADFDVPAFDSNPISWAKPEA